MPIERRRYTDGLETRKQVTLKLPASAEDVEKFGIEWDAQESNETIFERWSEGAKQFLIKQGLWDKAEIELERRKQKSHTHKDDQLIAGIIMGWHSGQETFGPEYRSAKIIFWTEVRRARWRDLTEQAPEDIHKLVKQLEWAAIIAMEAGTALRFKDALGKNALLGRQVRHNDGGRRSAKARNQASRDKAIKRSYAELRAKSPHLSKSRIAELLAIECRKTGTQLSVACGAKPPSVRTIRRVIAS